MKRIYMKKILAVLLCVAMLCALPVCGACGAKETKGPRAFTDSCGRTVELPEKLSGVAVTGPIAQVIVFALAPDSLVGLATEWEQGAENLIPEEYLALEVLGQLYGGKSEVNTETLLSLAPDVIIDIGEAKKSIVEDMDNLQKQTGIPCVHIESSLSTLGDTFRKVGELLGMSKKAEVLAEYCDTTYGEIKTLADSVTKADLLYVTGADGVNVIAKGSYHAEAIDMLCNNLAVVDNPSSKGTGNEVDMEQILLWDPEYVIFAPGSIYGTVANDPNWQGVFAIQDKKYAEAPVGIVNWMGFPPAAQRLLGMLWMAKLLYPEAADYDMYEKAAEFYKLFFHHTLTRDQYGAMVKRVAGN